MDFYTKIQIIIQLKTNAINKKINGFSFLLFDVHKYIKKTKKEKKTMPIIIYNQEYVYNYIRNEMNFKLINTCTCRKTM